MPFNVNTFIKKTNQNAQPRKLENETPAPPAPPQAPPQAPAPAPPQAPPPVFVEPKQEIEIPVYVPESDSDSESEFASCPVARPSKKQMVDRKVSLNPLSDS